MAQQAAAHHKKAAEHHEKAAHHAHLAQGYSQKAIHHGTDATKARSEHQGVAEQILKNGGSIWLLKPCSLR
jgi:hypothetical protein